MLEVVWPTWFTGHVAAAIKVVLLIFATVLGVKLANRLMHDYLERSRSKMMVNETMFRLLQHFIIAAIYFLGLILILSVVPQLNSVTIALVTGAGLAGGWELLPRMLWVISYQVFRWQSSSPSG